MKLLSHANILILGLAMASTAFAGTSLHTGGDVYQVPTSAVTEINYVEHYGQLFDQLDTNHDGLLQAVEYHHAQQIQTVSLMSGGYQRSPITVSTSQQPLTKRAFIALQNIQTVKQSKKMAVNSNPQQWLSEHIGNG